MSEHNKTTLMISRLTSNPALALSSYSKWCTTRVACTEYEIAALKNEGNAGIALEALARHYSQNKLKSREVVRSFSLDVMTSIAKLYPEVVLRFARENRDNPELLETTVLNKANSSAQQLRDDQAKTQAQLEDIYRAHGVHPDSANSDKVAAPAPVGVASKDEREKHPRVDLAAAAASYAQTLLTTRDGSERTIPMELDPKIFPPTGAAEPPLKLQPALDINLEAPETPLTVMIEAVSPTPSAMVNSVSLGRLAVAAVPKTVGAR